tara:strand:- start:241 stop:426 length:186 start_codon:yes stop_codon:yes gene_type:complete
MKMMLVEERRLSKIRQEIRAEQQLTLRQNKINLGAEVDQGLARLRIILDEIGWEAYEWQRK